MNRRELAGDAKEAHIDRDFLSARVTTQMPRPGEAVQLKRELPAAGEERGKAAGRVTGSSSFSRSSLTSTPGARLAAAAPSGG